MTAEDRMADALRKIAWMQKPGLAPRVRRSIESMAEEALAAHQDATTECPAQAPGAAMPGSRDPGPTTPDAGHLPAAPCPYCGGLVIVAEGFHLMCFSCGAAGPDADEATSEAALAAWNRRAGQQGEARPAREEVERQLDMDQFLTGSSWHRIVDGHKVRVDPASVYLDAEAAPEAQAEPQGMTIQRLQDCLTAKNEEIATLRRKVSEAQAEPAGEPVACPCGQSKAWCKVNRCCDAPAASGERDTLRALLSGMDRGVLTMPYELAMGGEMACRQFYDRVQSLIGRIDAALADGGAR